MANFTGFRGGQSVQGLGEMAGTGSEEASAAWIDGFLGMMAEKLDGSVRWAVRHRLWVGNGSSTGWLHD